MKFSSILSNQKGQSLLEVVFASALIGAILVAIVSAISLGVKNSQYSKNQALATRYAQEGLEWIRQQRDQLGWNSFGVIANSPIILNCDPIDTLPNIFANGGTCITTGTIPSMFTRIVDISLNSNNAEITVTVSWTEGSKTHNSTLTTIIYEWSRS